MKKQTRLSETLYFVYVPMCILSLYSLIASFKRKILNLNEYMLIESKPAATAAFYSLRLPALRVVLPPQQREASAPIFPTTLYP